MKTDLENMLVKCGLLRFRGEGRYYVNFSKADLEEAAAKSEPKTNRNNKGEVPDDLFSPIEGYEDLKDVFIKSLQADKPVHILLIGKPSTAKTLFLMELERLGGKMILGGTTSKAGIRDILLDTPKILIIDEMEKIKSGKDLSALLTWMESGRVIIAKYMNYQHRTGKGWVFAAANTTKGIPQELLSRFLKFNLREYTREEFIGVCIAVLTKRESVDRELARYITLKLADREYRDVRDTIKVARLSSTTSDVDRIIDTMRKYTRSR